MNKKKVVIGLGFVLVVIIGILIIVVRKTSPEVEPVSKESLNLIKTLPEQGRHETIFTKTAILFFFDSPINTSTAEVSIEPSIDLVVENARNDSRVLAVRPQNEWSFNVPYNITIKKGFQSANNKELKEDAVYQIEFIETQDILH